MKLNLQDISSHVQQRTFLSKHPNKKSPDRQALSTSHIEEPLYLHYNEDSISPPSQASCWHWTFPLLPQQRLHTFDHPHLSTILSSSFISHSNVFIFLSSKKKKNLSLTPIRYGNSSKEMFKEVWAFNIIAALNTFYTMFSHSPIIHSSTCNSCIDKV